jgi:UDP-N-acetylmuramoyl-L-alanyl-D-glutamate--2,6-diaminopimelate ligase
VKITELINSFSELSLYQSSGLSEVAYIQSDSRLATPDDIYCLYSSFGENSESYLQSAISRKVKILLVKEDSPYISYSDQFETVILSSIDPMHIHGNIASLLKGEPSKKLKIIAVTGTNGKTSLTYILGDITDRNRFEHGIIGTIKVVYGNKVIHTGYTTPDPSMLNSLLRDMLDAGIEYVFLEASSHGIKLGRLNGIHLTGAIFTNLTRDHLDFHETMEDYFQSKFDLFLLLSQTCHPDPFAVINADSKWGKDIISGIKKNKFPIQVTSIGKNMDYEIETKKLSLSGTEFTVTPKNGKPIPITTNLLGNFNSINVSIAFITSLMLGFDQEQIIDTVKNLHPIDGRFQIVSNRKKNRIAIVDYAHTPDALENVLKSLKEIPHTKLICLFGCGGDRDKTKRPMMGKIAAEYSDMVIITSDNPRTENPETILDEIQSGIPKEYKSVVRIVSRKQAIKKGIEILSEGGFLLVAGKGHENYQIIGNSKENFSDTLELQQAFLEDEASRR